MFPSICYTPPNRHLVGKGTINNNFTQYCEQIADSFCPYIRPAVERNILYYSLYSEASFPSELESFRAELFYFGLLHAELLRRKRILLPPVEALLLCDNVVITVPTQLTETSGRHLLDWPHWILKCLYTATSIVFGKFWIEEKQLSREGYPIPEPRCHFLSIRSAIKNLDPRFFSKAPALIPVLSDSHDDGKNVLQQFGIADSSELTLEILRSQQIYSRAKTWAENLIPPARH